MCGAIDDLYQENARFSNLLFFPYNVRRIGLSMVMYVCSCRVAYRTQVIGGVVVRVPIKLDEPTERRK